MPHPAGSGSALSEFPSHWTRNFSRCWHKMPMGQTKSEAFSAVQLSPNAHSISAQSTTGRMRRCRSRWNRPVAITVEHHPISQAASIHPLVPCHSLCTTSNQFPSRHAPARPSEADTPDVFADLKIIGNRGQHTIAFGSGPHRRFWNGPFMNY